VIRSRDFYVGLMPDPPADPYDVEPDPTAGEDWILPAHLFHRRDNPVLVPSLFERGEPGKRRRGPAVLVSGPATPPQWNAPADLPAPVLKRSRELTGQQAILDQTDSEWRVHPEDEQDASGWVDVRLGGTDPKAAEGQAPKTDRHRVDKTAAARERQRSSRAKRAAAGLTARGTTRKRRPNVSQVAAGLLREGVFRSSRN
jgi:hypothetical protein